jgi:hypothetical protein
MTCLSAWAGNSACRGRWQASNTIAFSDLSKPRKDGHMLKNSGFNAFFLAQLEHY